MDSQTQVRLVRRKSILSLLLYGLGIVLGGFAIFIASWGGMESIFSTVRPIPHGCSPHCAVPC